MTIEEKAKAYDEAIEKIKYVMEHGVQPVLNKEDLQDIFPELAESEEEKIRKAIKYCIKQGFIGCGKIENVTPDECLAWLKKQDEQIDKGEISDGYHTFNELYHQRAVLFAALVKAYRDKAWKSWKHEDGEECFGGGWFIVGIDTPQGSYTYHYKEKYWGLFECVALERAKHWDGHTDKDVMRLMSL